MCVICDKYKSGKVDGKQALMALNDALKQTKGPENKLRLEKHMFELSEIILGKEVPEIKANTEIDEAFWNSTHQED